MNITIRDAQPHEAAALSDIAVKAKSHWGYTAEQIQMWRGEFLTVTPDYIRAHQVWAACDEGHALVGFAAIEQHGAEAILEHLWVLPDQIRRGIGKALFRHVAVIVPEFVFTSDPHADAFYEKMGAQKIGEYASTLQGRLLTKFRYPADSA